MMVRRTRQTRDGKVGQVGDTGDGGGDFRRCADRCGEAAGVDVDALGGAAHTLIPQADCRPGSPISFGLVLGAGDGCGSGGFGGGGFDRLPGDGDSPGGDDQQHEQQKRRDADHRLDGGRAPLPVGVSHLVAHPVVIRSTGTVALCCTIGDQPGMTLNAAPWTVTVAWVAERLPDTDAFSKTSDPPAAATNDVAAAMPSLAEPVSAPAARAPCCAAAIATVRAW